MKLAIGIFSIAVLFGTVFFVSRSSNVVIVATEQNPAVQQTAALAPSATATSTAGAPASSSTPADPKPVVAPTEPVHDIELQPQLPNPPTVAKGLYITSWVAGIPSRVTSLINLVKKNGMNAVVVDIKDYSGYVSYVTGVPEIHASGAEGQIRIHAPNALLKQFHDNGIYVIGRITMFQDPVLAAARPEWAVQDKMTHAPWKDHKGIKWMDAGAKPVWDYDLALAKDAFRRGFDEIQIDYVRFPSDGNLSAMVFPFSDPKKSEATVIKDFFAYFRSALPGQKISADLFGLTTVAIDDLGIGQRIENAYPNLDFVSPMVYPSHFANGFIGYANPAQYPYEVIYHSMEGAVSRFIATAKQLAGIKEPALASSTTASSTAPALSNTEIIAKAPLAKIRPWLQAFDLGAVYDHAMIEAQIKAVEDSLNTDAHRPTYGGWLLWDPGVRYNAL